MTPKHPGALQAYSTAVAIAFTPLHALAGDGIAELLLKKGVITAEEYKQLKQEAGSTPVASASPAAVPVPARSIPAMGFSKGAAISSGDGAY